MKGLKQFGAMALATALTITLVAPISANAEVITNYERNAEGEVVKYTYTNEDTRKTSEHYDEVTTEDTVFTISTNSNVETKTFNTTVDVAKFTNFKSNKKALKVKVISSDEYTDPTPADKKTYAPISYDYKTETYYYKNVKGEWVTVPKADEAKLPKGDDSGEYTVRFFAKKAGTYKVTYDAILKDGTTFKKTLKVIAKADGAAIKSVTFAGKVIEESVNTDKPSTNRLWTKNSGYNVTTAKSGKIKVTMTSKDFKLKKIEVGTPIYKEVAGTDKDDFTKKYSPADVSSSLDEINGHYEFDEDGDLIYHHMTVSWKKVKNGKKIKLNKDNSYAHPYYKNHSYVDKKTTTPTYIRVTYYDKKNKTTKRELFVIYKVNK